MQSKIRIGRYRARNGLGSRNFPGSGIDGGKRHLESLGRARIRNADLTQNIVAPDQQLLTRSDAQPLKCDHLSLRRGLGIGSGSGLHIILMTQQSVKGLSGLIRTDLNGVIIRAQKHHVTSVSRA